MNLYNVSVYSREASEQVPGSVAKSGIESGLLYSFMLWANSRGDAINLAKAESVRLAATNKSARAETLRGQYDPSRPFLGVPGIWDNPPPADPVVYKVFDYGDRDRVRENPEMADYASDRNYKRGMVPYGYGF